MMYLLASFVALLGAGLAYTVYCASHAPVGYEDETGFHVGAGQPERKATAPELHNALPVFSR